MQRIFHDVAKDFMEAVEQFEGCDDKRQRKLLLGRMRMILNEADQLTLTHLRDSPTPGSITWFEDSTCT